MVMWEGYHTDNKIPVIVTVEYDSESEKYVVEVVRGLDSDVKKFKAKHLPDEGLMHVSDMEKSIKLANVLIKELKIKAQKRKRKK